MTEPTFFASPEEAVEMVNRLLSAGDWPALARYYDLSGTDVNVQDLETGAFFIGGSGDAPAHPAWSSRFLHPFPPGFRYSSHQLEGADAVVTVKIEIDQGGGMVQRGFCRFRMSKNSAGWRIRPDRVSG